MTAPTLAAIQVTVSEAVEDALATACYQGAESHGERDCECPTTGIQMLIEATAVNATLAALQPLVDQWQGLAGDNDRLGDWQDEQGRRGAALRAYGSRDAHNAVAKQLRALIGATGEKS